MANEYMHTAVWSVCYSTVNVAEVRLCACVHVQKHSMSVPVWTCAPFMCMCVECACTAYSANHTGRSETTTQKKNKWKHQSKSLVGWNNSSRHSSSNLTIRWKLFHVCTRHNKILLCVEVSTEWKDFGQIFQIMFMHTNWSSLRIPVLLRKDNLIEPFTVACAVWRLSNWGEKKEIEQDFRWSDFHPSVWLPTKAITIQVKLISMTNKLIKWCESSERTLCKGQRQRASERAREKEKQMNTEIKQEISIANRNRALWIWQLKVNRANPNGLSEPRTITKTRHTQTTQPAKASRPSISRLPNENWTKIDCVEVFSCPFRPLFCCCSVCCVSTTKFGRELLCSGRDLDIVRRLAEFSFVHKLAPPYACACVRQQQHPTQHHLEGKCGRPNNECLVLNNYQHSFKILRRVCVLAVSVYSRARLCMCVQWQFSFNSAHMEQRLPFSFSFGFLFMLSVSFWVQMSGISPMQGTKCSKCSMAAVLN